MQAAVCTQPVTKDKAPSARIDARPPKLRSEPRNGDRTRWNPLCVVLQSRWSRYWSPPHQEELRAAFNPSTGWNVVAIGSDRVQTRFHDDSAPAWLATIKRI